MKHNAVESLDSLALGDDTGDSFVRRVAGILQLSNDNGFTFSPVGTGFSSDVQVPMPNGSGATVTAVELISAVTGLTGAEASNFLIKLYRAGAQISSFKIDSETGLTIVVDKLSPAALLTLNASNGSSTTNGIKFQTQGGDRGIISCDVSGNMVAQVSSFFDVSNLAGTVHYFRAQSGLVMVLGSRFNVARGAAIAVATTITLGTDGNQFPLTVGTGTLNSIVATGFLSGAVVELDCPTGITITHNVAGTGATIVTNTGSSLVIPAGGAMVTCSYNGTTWRARM